MGILDKIVEWIAEQVMNLLDMISTSVLGALGCNMDSFLRYFPAAERYILLGVLVFTAPVAFAMGSAQSTSNIFKSWCRMFAGQMFLLVMNAWCLRLFTSMVGTFLSNPLFV